MAGLKTVIVVYVPGYDIMHFTDSCRFLISSAFKFTALCTILPHWAWGLEGGGDGPRNLYRTTKPGWLAYLGPVGSMPF